MMFNVFVLLSGLFAAVASAQEIPNFPTAQHIPESLVSSQQKLAPKLRDDAIRTRVRYGPFELPASNETHAQNHGAFDPNDFVASYQIDSPCNDCMVLGGKVTVEYADTTPASVGTGVYNHHVIIVNTNKPSTVRQCTDLPAAPMSEFFVAVNEDSGIGYTDLYTTPDGKFNSGYYVGPNDKVSMSAEMMNYRSYRQTVYVTVEAEYLAGKVPGFLDTTAFVLSAVGCGPQDINLTDTVSVMSSKPWSVPADGYIISAKGHLHDGGTAVSVTLNDNVICNSTATYGGKEGTDENWQTLSLMSTCTDPVAVKKGDQMSVTAYYNLNEHPMRMSTMGEEEGVMGFATIQFAQPL